MPIHVTSTAFRNGERIPAKYTADGQDVSPPLAWSGLPDGTRELALIMDDPDAPRPEPWVHWVIYKIPATADGLPEAVPPDKTLARPGGALQGQNSWNRIGYGGPAPPSGIHRYFFKLYALDAPLNLKPGLSKAQLLEAMQGHILGQGELMGRYSR